jgi:hemerythrin
MKMDNLIHPDDHRFQLGLEQMDTTHQEFISLVNRLNLADKSLFQELFAELLEHTQLHFESENQLMQKTGFSAMSEHNGEHLRVLGELSRFAQMVQKGSITIARSYVREMLPSWFSLHAVTMDSALAAHIKSIDAPVGQVEISMNL